METFGSILTRAGFQVFVMGALLILIRRHSSYREAWGLLCKLLLMPLTITMALMQDFGVHTGSLQAKLLFVGVYAGWVAYNLWHKGEF